MVLPGFRVAEEFNNCIRHMASYEPQRMEQKPQFSANAIINMVHLYRVLY